MAVDISGKTALVTGAAKRIGREIALTLAGAGVNIVVHYNRSQEEAEDLAGELRRMGGQAWTVQANFDRPEEYESLLASVLQTAGRLDILVNNASIFPKNTLDDLGLHEVVTNLEINAWVPFLLTRDFARQVGKGSVINLLDSRITGYDWTHVAYLLSKHLLAELTKMCALQFAPEVAVNGIGPGLILPPPGRDMSYIESMEATVPLKRHGDPQDIADAVLYLAQADFLTGEVIYVDGGRHLWEYTRGPHPD